MIEYARSAFSRAFIQKGGSVKVYRGRRTLSEVEVTVNGHLLNPRVDLRIHTLGNYDWGSDDAGSAQLALALLADYCCDDRQALAVYQEFKSHIVVRIRDDQWVLDDTFMAWALDGIRPIGASQVP